MSGLALYRARNMGEALPAILEAVEPILTRFDRFYTVRRLTRSADVPIVSAMTVCV
ncbi:hypothetical protein [Streptomyces sp. AD55]|uniref:hypothetical protein n=1 Tax=Streptomyces sp. AD55 TaxID=3242895 RepID=UPI0035278883